MPLSASRFPLRWLAAAAVAATLAACGGGDDDPLGTDGSSDPVAGFVGSWETRCKSDSGASARVRADLHKVSSTILGGDVIAYYYVGTSCSGPSVKRDKALTNMRMTLVGEQAIQGVTAQQFTGSSDQGESKVLLYTNGNTLLIGDPDAPEDANGYPIEFFEESFSRMK